MPPSTVATGSMELYESKHQLITMKLNSSLILTTFQRLHRHTWLVATILVSADRTSPTGRESSTDSAELAGGLLRWHMYMTEVTGAAMAA